jgi:hypothetical protein
MHTEGRRNEFEPSLSLSASHLFDTSFLLGGWMFEAREQCGTRKDLCKVVASILQLKESIYFLLGKDSLRN